MGLSFTTASEATLIGLPKRRLLRIAAPRGTRIENRRGSVWITQEGDRRDVVLAAGEAHLVERDTPLIVQALSGALLAVCPVSPAA